MKMKHYLVLGMALAFLFVFSACGAGDWQNASSGTESTEGSETSSSQAEVVESNYEDSLDGLCSYLAASGIISGDPTEMDARLIGAKAGRMYTHSFEGGQASVELYEYDLENLNDAATTTIESVKETGKFTLLGIESEAILSDSGKYLMIYKSSGDDEANTAQQERAETLFREFKKQ